MGNGRIGMTHKPEKTSTYGRNGMKSEKTLTNGRDTMTDLIERAKAALEGYTDDDINDSEYLSFARLAVEAWELHAILQIYQLEIPLKHQPYMIALEADEAL